MKKLSIFFSLVGLILSGATVKGQGDDQRPERFKFDSVKKSDTAKSRETGSEFEPSRLLAIVGDEPIFVGDLLFEVNQLIARFMPNAPEQIVQRERQALIDKMLPKYVDQKLLLIDVKSGLPAEVNFDSVIESSTAEFDDKALDELMKSAGVDSPVMFDAHLRAQGSSLRKLRKSWTVNQIVRYFLSQKIQTDAEVSHQELLSYYRENEAEFQVKAKARWEQVMVRHDKFPSSADAMSEIIELGNKIVYGASLDGVAKKSSHGFYAQEGGYHDWTDQGSLVLKEIDAAIFSLPVGQLSDIIRTEQGYHILRVVERVDAGKVEFREAQVEIKKKLESEKRLAAFDAHMEKLRQTIPVEIMGEKSAKAGKPSEGNTVTR